MAASGSVILVGYNRKMQRLWRRYRPVIPAFLSFITPLLLFIAFINYRLSWLVGIALIPYLFFLYTEADKPRPRYVLITWLIGLFTMLLIIGWLVATDTQGWLQINGPILQITVFLVWLAMGA